jgi:RHS repeat-associated protein
MTSIMLSAASRPTLAKNARMGHPRSDMGKERKDYGQGWATRPVSGVDFWHKDWLGSVRLVSSRGGRASLTDRAFAPYGETYKNIGAATNVNFTGDNQDLVAGTYDTPNRELNPNQGRWISPDPAHVGWNAYAYSTKPLGTVDTSGLCDGWAGDGCAGDGSDFGDGSIGGLAIDGGPVSLLSSVIPVGFLVLPCYPNCGGVGGGDDWFQPVIYLPLGLGGDCIGSGCVVPAGITPRIGVPGDTVDVIGTPCAPPTAPAGSGANVDQNIAATKSAVSTFHPVTAGLPGGSPTGDVGAFDGWYNHVKGGGDWDYAKKYGRNSANSMFDNFNYGATCSAMGFSLETCQRGAGAVDYYNAVKNVFNGRPWSAGPGNPFTGSPVNVHGYPDYGDQTHYAENESVIAGWIYGSGGCQ